MGLFSSLGGRRDVAGRECITLGSVALPSNLEAVHTLAVGSTGTGKSSLIAEVLSTIIPRGDRCIGVDPNGGFLSRFHRDGDVVLNPFDRRSPGWSAFNEVRKDFDYDRLARSLVPDGQGADRSWHGYAQMLTSELLRTQMRHGDTTTASLVHRASIAPARELAELLSDTPAAGLFQPGAEKALASTRFILGTQIQPQKYLLAGDFSLRDWLSAGTGNLYLTWRSDMLTSLRPLVGCWVDILLSAALSLSPSDTRCTWFVCDELAAVGQLSSLESALTLGRKHGLCVLAGLQSVAQLDRLYGRETSTVLRSCFRNLVVLGIAKTDPSTAEEMSKALGERELDREQKSVSQGSSGTTQSASLQRVKERLVLPSEITDLPDLHGYLALAGAQPIRKIRIEPCALPVIALAFEEA